MLSRRDGRLCPPQRLRCRTRTAAAGSRHERIQDWCCDRTQRLGNERFVVSAAIILSAVQRRALADVERSVPPECYDKKTGAMVLSIHAWRVDTGRHLVDTCVGNDKDRHARTQWTRVSTPFLERLAELRAKYIFGKKEYKDWDQLFRMSYPAGHHLATFVDSVVPIVDAGQALIVDNSFSLEDCATIEPAPGHMPGHIAIWLRSEGACYLFSGDIIHHLVQLRHPDWSCMGCQDPNQSASTRSALLSKIADADVHLMTGHFLPPHAGRISSTAQNCELECHS